MRSTQLEGHDFYDPAKSSSAKEISGARWMIQYGDQSTAGGNVYTDKVTVAGITAPQQAIEAASQVSSLFVQDEFCDGLLGLAFSSINTGMRIALLCFFHWVGGQ